MFSKAASFLLVCACAFGGNITVGPNFNITQLAGNQAESTISINPNNTQNIFASDTISNLGRFSLDGGLTWKTSNMAALPSSIGDVQTAWDQYGNLFLTRFGPSQSIIVARSTDGGATFGDVRNIGGVTGADQPSIAVGANSVWVSFTNNSNQVVAAGASVTGLGLVGAFSGLETAPGGGGDFGDIAIGPAGQVALVYQNNGSGEGPDTIKFNLDSDGLGAGGLGAQSSVTGTNVGGFDHIPAQNTRTIDAEANLAWDRTGGIHNGRLYMVYTDEFPNESNNTDIMLRFSDNNGATWSSAVRVNDDATTRSQFLPAISIDQTTGNIAITWYDARNDPSNIAVQVWGAVSFDNGLTFSPNFQISAGTSNASVDPNFDFGDYDKMDFTGGVFYRSWADNSNSTGDNPDGTSKFDIYSARVSVSGVPEPATWLMAGAGVGLLVMLRRRC
jgi:hypothetical protein